MTTRFKSCYIVDVSISQEEVVLQDSAKYSYHISVKDTEVMDQFKQWFKTVFSKGIAQTLTVFQYDTVDISECEVETRIVKFLLKDRETV